MGIRPFLAKNKKGIIYETFRGKIIVQFFKLIFYFCVGLAILIFVIFVMDKLDSLKEKRRRKIRRKEVLSLLGDINEKEYLGKKIAADIYIDNGMQGIRKASQLLGNTDMLMLKIKQHAIEKEIDKLNENKMHKSWEYFGHFNLMDCLLGKGILSIDEKGTLKVDPFFKENVDKILAHESKMQKGEKKKDNK